MIPIDDNIFVAQPDATRICSFNISFDCTEDDIECLFDGGSILIYRRKKQNFTLINLNKNNLRVWQSIQDHFSRYY